MFHIGVRPDKPRRLWVAVHAARTVDTPVDAELTLALRNAMRRVRRALDRAGVPAEPLAEEQALAAIAGLDHVTGGRNEVREDWRFWRTGPVSQATFRLTGWDGLTDTQARGLINGLLAGVPGVASTVALGAQDRTPRRPARVRHPPPRRHDRGRHRGGRRPHDQPTRALGGSPRSARRHTAFRCRRLASDRSVPAMTVLADNPVTVLFRRHAARGPSNAGVEALLASASREVLVMSTLSVAARDPIGGVRRIDHENLRRGVRYRVIVPDTARTAPVLATRLGTLALAGADTRTVPEVPTDALVIDGSVVVLPVDRTAGGRSLGTAVFRLSSVVTTTHGAVRAGVAVRGADEPDRTCRTPPSCPPGRRSC